MLISPLYNIRKQPYLSFIFIYNQNFRLRVSFNSPAANFFYNINIQYVRIIYKYDKKEMFKSSRLKILIILVTFLFLIPFLSSCDHTLIDIFTEINADYSGTRTIDVAIKTEYIQKSEVVLGQDQTLFDKIFENLPEGEYNTFEDGEYTHFNSKIEFEDIRFLPHISIDNLSEYPLNAKMEVEEHFFYNDYYFEDYIDMKIDEILLETADLNSDYNSFDDLAKADSEILNITYQVKFPVKIINHNGDITGDNNIIIWNIKYGDEKMMSIEGKKTKLLTYFLIVILGIIGLFIIFIILVLIFGSRRSKGNKTPRKPLYSYDNYFKKDRYFRTEEPEDWED
jgi:hypothetical protein